MKTVSLLFLLIIFAGVEVSAQFYFFGRNKVQYENFDWKVLKTEHFDIYYYSDMDEIAQIGAAYAEDAYKYLRTEFNHVIFRRTPLIFYNTHIHFQQTNTTPGFIPEGVGGFFEFIKGRVVIPYSGSLERFRHVIYHEMVHVFMTTRLMRIANDYKLNTERFPPLWFVEGLAEFYSTTWDSRGEMVIRDAVLNDYLPGIEDIYSISGTFLMYKEGQAFLGFIDKFYGREKILMLLNNIWMFDSFKEMLEYTLGKPLAEIDREWKSYLKKIYYPLYEDYVNISDKATVINKTGYSFSPVVKQTEGGIQIFFTANLDGYSSLYQIEKKNGEKVYSSPKLIIQGERSSQLESFHLFDNAPGISPEGIIAFSTKSGSADAIHFYSTESGSIAASFSDESLVSISSPSFNSKGDRVVFSAIDKKGYSDLYVYNLTTEEMFRVTNDYYEDRTPVFGKDDREIIFASDRTSGANKGYINLFRIELHSLNIYYVTDQPVNIEAPRLTKGKYGLIARADYDSVDNFFYIDVSDKQYQSVYRISSFISPVFDHWLVNDSTMVFSGFENSSFRLYERSFSIPDTPLVREMLRTSLPAWTAGKYESEIAREEIYYENEYTLDYAQSQISTDPVYGTSGGAVLSLSDLFSNDNYFFLIYNTAQVQDDFLKSFNIALTRLNLSERTNYSYGIFHFSGRRYDLRDTDEFFYERSFGGSLAFYYPLSKFDRIEANVTIANSDKQVITGVVERKALLHSNSVSYVFDNSLWMPSGPVDGTRLRLLLGYTTDVKYSNVNYYTIIADMRYYYRLSLRSALALRGSLYFNDGKEARRYFMGGSWDLRGWPRWAIRGEKMWIQSTELRFPLFDQIRITTPIADLGFFGIRGALFWDSGGAWDKSYETSIGSIGGGIRFNLFNIIILRYDVGKKIEENYTKLQKGLFYQFFFGFDF
ncbi:MAG: hypothetical protein AMXMBFR48_17030 [Ignavibacteriales bacterium]